MKVAIIGTRGIPNQYGGFEQLATYLSVGLVDKGHEVFVYNSDKHGYKEKSWKNVNIVHCFDPEDKLGSAGQFIYDLNCILDARKRKFHLILILGYTSSSIWGRLYPRKSVILFNMDGMEWKRSKYSSAVKKFLLFAERLAIKFSNYVIADSVVIKSYLDTKYGITTNHIAYGAEVYNNEDEDLLKEYGVSRHNYYICIGRMVRENNFEMILDGFNASNSTKKFLVISDPDSELGAFLIDKYKSDERITFPGTIFEAKKLHTLRVFSHMYFHGHSVGGTNPCLIEAMASKALVAANDNAFNRAILEDDALYFCNAMEVRSLIENTLPGNKANLMIQNNSKKIKEQYNWQRIIDQYEDYMLQCCNQPRQ